MGAKVVVLGISRGLASALASSVIRDRFSISLNVGQPKSGDGELCLLSPRKEMRSRTEHTCPRVWLDVSSGDFL